MVVLDSSFLIACHNARDVHHEAARTVLPDLSDGVFGDLLLPEYIFLETVTVIAARCDLGLARQVGQTLLDASEIELVPCFDHFADAFRIFRSQADASLSFADAAVVAIARAREAKYVATFDADFARLENLAVVPS